jgi:hypothetical protein
MLQRFLILVAIAPLGPAVLAEAFQLPVSAVLEQNEIEVELRGGRVEVTIDPEIEPSIEALDFLEGEESHGFVILEPIEKSHGLRISQAYGDDTVAPRIVVRLNIRPLTRLLFRGSELQIQIVDLRVDRREESAPDASAATRPAPATSGGIADPTSDLLKFLCDDSDIQLDGVRYATLGGRHNRFSFQRSSGPIRGQFERGRLEVEGHRGSVELTTTGCELQLSELNGSLTTRMEGGSLAVSNSHATVDVIVRSGNAVEFDSVTGRLGISLFRTPASVRRCGDDPNLIDINSEESQLEIESSKASMSISVRNVELSGSDWQARAMVSVTGLSRFELGGAKQGIDLRVQDGSEARLRNVEGKLSARIQDSRLELSAIKDLDLFSESSTVEGTRIEGISRLDGKDSDLDLDLSYARSFPAFKLGGTTRARFALANPCVVRVAGEHDETESRIQASGCQVIGTREPLPSQLYSAGRQPQLMTLQLESGTQVEVRALP